MKPNEGKEKHQRPWPKIRTIRRACNKELYRTIKKLKIRIPPEQVAEAEKLYLQKVIDNWPFVMEHQDNRKALSDWWEKEVAPHVADMWKVDPDELSRAFRHAFGG